MKQITDHIMKRRSVRTFDGCKLSEEDLEKLRSFMGTIENPFGIPVEFKFLHAKEHGLICPVVSGTELYVGGKIKKMPNANVAFGYSFEMFVLFAQSLGIGTVWLGGTMNRAAFEKAMELGADEIMPCASPLGYPAKKMSLREGTMRKAIKADERLPFEDLFYEGDFKTPLHKERAGVFLQPLEMVRLAPSAVNKQPWRVVIADNAAHFYLKRSKGFGHETDLDMQKIDMGIALCHFALTAKESGLDVRLTQMDSISGSESDMEYIASIECSASSSR
ncbi:MAG: nitroreductase [Lachnospiraceae bacterium]|nr:nitroreductase [Lachnospiraceae bacterium]